MAVVSIPTVHLWRFEEVLDMLEHNENTVSAIVKSRAVRVCLLPSAARWSSGSE